MNDVVVGVGDIGLYSDLVIIIKNNKVVLMFKESRGSRFQGFLNGLRPTPSNESFNSISKLFVAEQTISHFLLHFCLYYFPLLC